MTVSTVAGPLSLRLETIAAMLNAELVDDPVYDGVELQWFDDERSGTGMLAFLSRREGRQVDYYQQPGLRLDRSGYQLGGGTRSWSVVDFDVARLVVTEDGVDAEVRFTDVDGRQVEVRVDDRDGRPRRRGGLLAPVGDGIERPTSLLLVWMPAFDLVRRAGRAPVVRIGGRQADVGRLPGSVLHRRHLIKYAAPLVVVQVNPDPVRPAPEEDAAPAPHDGWPVTTLSAQQDGHTALLTLDPGMPHPRTLGSTTGTGRWQVEVDGARLTGGSWSASASATGAQLAMDVDERWSPGRLPLLMRLVTTVIRVFRTWPTTYGWRCEQEFGEASPARSGWRRTGRATGEGYRRATSGRGGQRSRS